MHCQTVSLFVFATVLLFAAMSMAYPGQVRRAPSNIQSGDDSGPALNAFTRNKWCARWGETCVQETKMPFARCCSGLRCICGAFWAQNKCECKTTITMGNR